MRWPWMICLLAPAAVSAADHCTNDHVPATTPDNEFEIHGDGTVTHARTGLMWSRCVLGQNGADCTGTPLGLPWDAALNAADGADLAGRDDWRLPTRAELASLVEYCRAGPSINPNVFPGGVSYVWTGTPFPEAAPARAWAVRFDIGHVLPFTHGTGANVRLVRTLTPVYAVGDTGPSGGIVFYDKGDYDDGWRYLEAAPRLWNDGDPDPWLEPWGCAGTLVGATATAVGTGAASTALLTDAGCRSAEIAAEAEINGYADWFLPSRDELRAFHDHVATHTNFRNEHGLAAMSYASATELDAISAVAIDFAGGGGVVHVSKSAAWVVVRPIRAF